VLISNLLFLAITNIVFASEDVGTFCFENNTPVSRVQSAIDFLQTGNDKIQLRNKDNCLDIYSSSDRLKLYEKMIYKNFSPISTGLVENNNDGFSNQCRIELKEIKNSTISDSVGRIGSDAKLKVSDKDANSTTRSELLMTSGKRSSLTAGEINLFIECVKTKNDIYQLAFFLENQANAIQTSIDVKVGEVIDLGGIVKELNEKSKTIGVPVTEIKTQTGTIKTKYELRVL
jgi:hypothetical protein